FVAAIRRRRSSRASSEMSTWNGRISVAVSTVLLMTTSVVRKRFRVTPLLWGTRPTLRLPGGAAQRRTRTPALDGRRHVRPRVGVLEVAVGGTAAERPGGLENSRASVGDLFDLVLLFGPESNQGEVFADGEGQVQLLRRDLAHPPGPAHDALKALW